MRKKNMYQYKECGLDSVWLENGFAIEDSPYGKGVSITNMEGLHECIASVLVDKPTPLTGAEFRFLRRELDLSQRMVGELFGRSEREVRKWEGEDEVPEPFNLLIRHIYEERRKASKSFEDLFERLKKLDREWHESLTLKADDGHWRAAC